MHRDLHVRTPGVLAGALAAGALIALAAAPLAAQETRPAAEPTSYLSLQADPENCLSCHRFRGLSRLDRDTGDLRLFFCSVEYYSERQGPHSRLRCTACHQMEEVLVIPHQVRTPVDCTRTCHIVPSSGVEIRFSHAPIAESLARSSHTSERLAQLRFEQPLLRPGQSMCLYCHDEPAFRDLGDIPRPIGQGGVTSRCEMCHGEGMPADVKYYSEHVTSRLQPARPVRQLAQVCAVCHSDPAIIAQMDSHDTVASYLHSFHGKANLLGSRETANCLDCHASELGDVHLMMSKTNPESSTSDGRLPSTCRTTECHPGAPPGMSQAAVHLNLDPHERTPEFYVAAMFVLMTAAVMTLFFILIILELFNTVIRRRDPHHEKMVRLARKLQEHPEGRRVLTRMTPHQRVQHWLLAVFFTALVLTGMPIKFAEAHWASWLINVMGGLPTARWLHRVCGVILMAAFVYHLIYLLIAFIERVRAVRRSGRREPLWRMVLNSPMFIGPDDVRMFGQLFAYLLFIRRERPRFGHFNFMQKFEYWAVFWGMPVMGLSGLALWGAPGVSEFVSGRVLNFAFIIHSDEAFLAFIYIAVVHIFSVVFAPVVFPVSTGTLTGQVPAGEIVEGHLGEIEELAKRLNIRVEDEPLPRLTPATVGREVVRRTYAIGLICFCAIVGFTSIRFLYELLLTRQTAPIEIVEIPKRLDAELLAVTTQTPGGHTTTGETRPRGPLAHFHQIPSWFQADPGNNCTTSGCHAPLPHGNRIEVRAFLNMHTTFVDCMVCHAEGADRHDASQWFALPSRRQRGTPAVLQIAEIFETTPEIDPAQERAFHQRLLGLLGEAIADSGDNAQLREWHLRLETSYVGSRAWHAAIHTIRTSIRMHVHGEYNAKIGLYQTGRLLTPDTPDRLAATREYLEANISSADPRGKSLLATIHADLRPMGAMCTPCHAAEPTLVDFDQLGYPASRADSLKSSRIVRQVLSVESGTPFHLPRIAEEPHDR